MIDYGSDLVFFDLDNKTLTNIFKTKDRMETFPCWTPDGKKIYYCSAYYPKLATLPDSTHSDRVLADYDSIRYNLMSVEFDEQTRTFGEPTVEFRSDSLHKSCTWPRVSPDGRYVLFTLADYGQFHIWHRSSDLYIKDVQTGDIRPLSAVNSETVDSNHSWSSNGGRSWYKGRKFASGPKMKSGMVGTGFHSKSRQPAKKPTGHASTVKRSGHSTVKTTPKSPSHGTPKRSAGGRFNGKR